MSVSQAASSASVIATATSETTPLPGQKNRSGPDFSLLSNDGGTITIVAPAGYKFKIMQDVSLGPDKTPVPDGENGKQIAGAILRTGLKYYIADPEDALAPFVVELTQ
jgi:hypothetical protein